MSSRPESKTASQFATLTMKLKDKIHQQRNRYAERIKHTPSLRSKPPDLDLTQHTHKDKRVCELGEQQRIVINSLQYFKALVDRFGVERVERVEQQPCVVGVMLGGASSTVLEEVHTLVQLEPRLHSSRSISACLARLHAAVADLIRWVDRVILQVVTAGDKESTGSVATVIKVVLDGVKELVRLAAERKEGAAPVSPVQSQPAVELLTCPPAEEDEPPPKPVMPLLEHRHSLTPPQTFSPPALPPKKRPSSSGPAPCRVAIVAPMRRETEAERQECEEDDLKSCSSSSADSGVQLTVEEDPDYDFLHTDLSSSETLPPLPPPSSLPPTLPEKRRLSAAEASSSQSSPAFEFDPAHQEQIPAHSDDVTDPESLSSPLSPSKSPPPLPEKKRHIHQYLQFCSSYSAQSTAMFYSRPSGHSQRHSTKRPTHTHQDPDSASTPEPAPAPALPPKKRQQDADEDDEESEEQLIRDGSHGLQQEEEQQEQQEQEEQEEQEEQQDEVLLKKKEILHRIIMTPEGDHDDGPDVKAASPDILLAYAAETESSTEPGYREAFLYTYRCFISPSDVISKLQHRYRHLKDGAEPEQENAFNLLVSVVDQLSAVELEPDLLLLLMDSVFSLLIGGELTQARQLRSVILSKMELKWQLIGCPQSLQPLAARGVAARPGTLLDFGSHDLAEQLTLRDSELFYKIELQEVLLWSKEQNEEKSPNLTAFTQHFNNVSFWVRSVIMLQDKPHDREKLLLKFLKIMKHLRRLNNFNSYLSILSGLDSAPLRRLDWQRNTAESLEEYSSLIDSSSSFRAYRAALHEADPPCIPYLGLILQDLTFVHLGNPDKLMTPQGSKVNFSKNWQQFNILETLRTYQQTRYQLQANDDIISFFNEFRDHLAEEALWELSLRLRPRNAPRANHK